MGNNYGKSFCTNLKENKMTDMLISLGLLDIGKKIFHGYVDDYFKKFINLIEDTNTKNKLFAKASEKGGDEVNRELELLANTVWEEPDKVYIEYFEESIKNDFTRFYEELSTQKNFDFDDSRKGELFKRYKIFIEGYRKYINKQMTISEKCILKEISQVEKGVDRIEKGVCRIEKEILKFDDIQKILQEQRLILHELHKDRNIPFIDISNAYLRVEYYASKYEFLGNRFKFIKTSDEENDDVYIFTLYIKNIGERLIEQISVKNFNVKLCAEDEHDTTTGYFICDIIEHCDQPAECSLNLMSGSEQKIHFMVRDTRYELNKEKLDVEYDDYDEIYCNDRLFIQFDMKLTNDTKDANYHYYIFASRNEESYENIEGIYSVDYVGCIFVD